MITEMKTMGNSELTMKNEDLIHYYAENFQNLPLEEKISLSRKVSLKLACNDEERENLMKDFEKIDELKEKGLNFLFV